MKTTIYLLSTLFLFLASSATYAQNVGIGTTSPNNSALVDMVSSSKGLLIPRMSRTNRDAISSPAPSLIIYQTTESPGFYYNAGSSVSPKWQRLAPTSDTLVIGPEAFVPISSSIAYATNAHNARYIPTDGSTQQLRASVFLPAGVTIKSMKFFFYDKSSTANLNFTLKENYLEAGLVRDTPFDYTSSSFSESIRNATMYTSHTINNDLYSYYVSVAPTGTGGWSFEAQLSIKGVAIVYQYN